MTEHPPPDEPLRPDELAALAGLLANETVWADPPDELEEAVVAEIVAAAAASDGGPAAPTRFGRPVRWLAAAAVVAVAFGAGALLTDGDERPTPEGEEFALSVLDHAPDASGSVLVSELSNGVRILLTVENLPPAPEGQFYEAWLHTETEVVSAGTFHMRTGGGTIPLWAGVLTEDYPLFSITLEDEDGDPAPSGLFVMTTDVS